MINSNINQYIGITDFMDFREVQEMLKVFKMHRQKGSKRKLHVGVMMGHKTLHGLPTKFQDAFPPKEKIASIFSSDETMNCLHYADYHDELDLWKSLAEAIRYGGIGIHALQLDMIWPSAAAIAEAVHVSRKQIEVILQIGKNAFEEIKNDPDALVEKLRDYDGVIHRVLLDKSMGRGLGMNAEELLPYARAIRKNFPNLGLVFAGGLGPKTVHIAELLIKEFPDSSIDAQGKLRPSENALDPVDWSMASQYLIEALELYNKYN